MIRHCQYVAGQQWSYSSCFLKSNDVRFIMALAETHIRIKDSVSGLFCCFSDRTEGSESDDSADEYVSAVSDSAEEEDVHTEIEYYISNSNDGPVEIALYNRTLIHIMKRHQAEERRKKRNALHCSWPTGRSTLRQGNSIKKQVHGEGARRAIRNHRLRKQKQRANKARNSARKSSSFETIQSS